MSAVPLPIPSHLVAAVEAVLRGEAVVVPLSEAEDNYARMKRLVRMGQRTIEEWCALPQAEADLRHAIFAEADMGAVFAGQWLPTASRDKIRAAVSASPYAAAPGEGEPEADDRPEWELRTGFREEDFA